MRYLVSSVCGMLCNRRLLWLIIISLHIPITYMGLETKTSGPPNTGKGQKLRAEKRAEVVSEKRHAPNKR